MGYRSCPRARFESAAADCVGAAKLPSSVALSHSRVAAGVCYSVASGTSAEIGVAAT